MSDCTKVLVNARKLLIYQNNSFVWRGEFISLSSDINLTRGMNKIFAKTYDLIKKIFQDIGNIGIILKRLEWMRQKTSEDEYLYQNWQSFASVDIEHFFVELRSIMDYIAEIIVCTAKHPEQLPKKDISKSPSFEKIRNWASKNPENSTKLLGKEITEVIISSNWFPHIRLIRDGLVHEGGFALVFLEPKEGILFQVYKGFRNIVNYKMIMYNDNIAYFDRFVAIYFSHLLLFLERFSKAIRSILEPKHIDCKASSGCSEIIVEWMDSLIKQ
ncbi:Uncharacterised protein [uncultured archaeon]|nr:Uncharacterised protein [uncultured archaeon]